MASPIKRITVLGSTGSIGTQTLDIVHRFPERFRVEALVAGRNLKLLSEQIHKFSPRVVSVSEEADRVELANRFPQVQFFSGRAGACAISELEGVDLVVMGIVGFAALAPTLSAIRAGKTIALANKESLVVGGALLVKDAQRSGAKILPVDSEHNAVFQLLEGVSREAVSSIVLTASGGPLLRLPDFPLEDVTPAMAIRHPKWSMGPKISVDSATLMNKGLEVIEAHYLFQLPEDQIEVWVHPQSIVHGAVVMRDNSVVAHLSRPDMHGPIAHAMAYPERLTATTDRMSFKDLAQLEFLEPDLERFPALALARTALRTSPNHCIALNSANEIAVEAFLKGTVLFPEIPRIVERVLDRITPGEPSTLVEILECDAEFRRMALAVLHG